MVLDQDFLMAKQFAITLVSSYISLYSKGNEFSLECFAFIFSSNFRGIIRILFIHFL
jgi:hypothetical protein